MHVDGFHIRLVENHRILSSFAVITSLCENQCENLVGVMVFGHKAADNILPWLRMNFFQKFLIQIVFLSHPQNIQWRYTLKHSRSYVVTFRANMNLFGVDIPPLEGVVQLRFLMTKKCTLEMMECVEEFMDSEVLEAVHHRTDKVKISRMAKVEEMMEMEVLKLKEMKVTVAAAAAAEMKEEAAKKKGEEMAVVAAEEAAVAEASFEMSKRWRRWLRRLRK